MLVPLAQVEVIGLRARLDDALAVLQSLRVAEVVTMVERAEPPDDLADLARRVDAVCSASPDRPTDGTTLDDEALRAVLERLEPQVAALLAQQEGLRVEIETLPRYIEALEALLPLVPELARLEDRHLADLGLATVALVLDDPDGRVVAELSSQLKHLLGRLHLMVTSIGEDAGPVGCLLVFRRADISDVKALLGSERIANVGVPDAYTGRSLHSTVEAMRERRAALPAEQEALQRGLVETIAPVLGTLRATTAALTARAERAEAGQHADVSARTFVLRLWVPVAQTAMVEQELRKQLGAAVAVARLAGGGSSDDPPVLLRNRPGWQPFQRLVGFLSWPTPGGVDPTRFMAVGLPLFFGVMVGDVVYGAALLAISWVLRRRWADNDTVSELGRVLTLGGWWAVAFGILFGEALGDLGHTLGLPAVWFYRGGPEALEPLLLFALAIGSAHIVLGLLLGLWTAARGRRGRQVAEKSGSLLVLAGLFGLTGVTVAWLPAAMLTPAVGAVVVGIVVASASQGALGLLLGPLEVLGMIGNILSYLRLAAVGLASVYLAHVANQLAVVGPLLLGIVVASFFHALNLALAAFSPMIQALRLHYVEFFGEFHDGGGRLFSPLGRDVINRAVEPGPPAAQLTRTTPEPLRAGSAT
ncbi:MAG: hypothetical protein GEU96_10360 [Propionibacteriales bacterium]|nr:hypothetical protein [Propionibacteriales bacterium]